MNIVAFVWAVIIVAFDIIGFISFLLNQIMPGGIIPFVVSLVLSYYVIAVVARGILGLPGFVLSESLLAIGFACECVRATRVSPMSPLGLIRMCFVEPAGRYLKFAFCIPWPLNVFLVRCSIDQRK